jgi:hypothetical protein
LLVLLCIFIALAFAGQLFDCITTFIGVDEKKITTEGNPNWFAQLIAPNSVAVLIVKPLAVLGIGAALLCLNLLPFKIAGCIILAFLAFRGAQAGFHNYGINKGK